MPDRLKALARLEPVDLRTVWEHEAQDFTPWLAQPENLRLLGETLGLELEDARTEEGVGRFSADIVATNTATSHCVLIENQLEKTNHTHLGQILTYAAGLDALTVIWIARRFTSEHRGALDWLNEHTGAEIAFFGVEIEVWRIGDSARAPKFNIVAMPNEWTRAIRWKPRPPTPLQQKRLEFWSGFHEYATKQAKRIQPTAPSPRTNMDMAIGKAGFSLVAFATWDETVNEPEIRAEFYIKPPDAKHHFEALKNHREEIETALRGKPEWHSEEGVEARRVRFRRAADWRVESERRECYRWLVEKLDRLHKVFQPRIQNLP